MPNQEYRLLEGRVEACIHWIRGEKVLLDRDLAELYGVDTKRLKEQVRRNSERFPPDFMFELDPDEEDSLRSQIATSNVGRGGRRYPSFAFTEQGVAMLSSVLRTPRAVEVNIEIMRAFVRLRRILASHAELARKLDELERRSDARFREVFDALRALMAEDRKSRRRIGFGS